MGPEATIVVKDVLQLDDAEAPKVKRWAIHALVAAARKPADLGRGKRVRYIDTPHIPHGWDGDRSCGA